ncbi:MAG: hypothetical protein RMN52_14125 [Anaerolineae bacterium]|nr:hypothetical protein [Candidatus Roseilinea sp.]MDW8451132.1 hypothetical protein [Anaerolineae bacterium]
MSASPDAVEATQDPNLGSATGQLLLRGQPVTNRILYLAQLTTDASGKETAAGMDRINSPRTFSQANGAFTFVNVPPGRYALVMDLIMQAYMLRNPKTGEDLIIQIEAGRRVDLGALDYQQLPE